MATGEGPNRGPELLAVNIFFCVLAGVIVLLRCYSRAALIKGFGLDDWLMILSTLFFLAYCVMSNLGVKHGTGQHQGSLAKEDIKQATMYWWFCYIFFSLTMITSKVSFAWFLLRITTTRSHSLIIYGASLCTVVAGGVFFFVTLFQCNPISSYWDKDQGGHCLNMNIIMALAYLYSVFSVITDFTFAILPGFIIWHLKLKTRARVALIGLVVMGCAASSAVVVRCGYLVRFKDPDFLWATTDIAIWSTVEMGLAISAASLATLRPLFKMVAWRLGIASRQTTSARTPYGASIPQGRAPNSTHGVDTFDNRVYVLSEFTQGTSKVERFADWKVGTHTVAYAEHHKKNMSDHDVHMTTGSVDSQENLNREQFKGM
ncbi:hypothetical protein JDV02_010290 [Purpureocillium takamizusanense]|uniref:Rhodopsin domain-containing protein n=1 Tax=Purpureocillium takamizusanense TaxID=2060973 RepID=A0A9Q8QRQ9_9HYPO|nr:uncharacterized protein JDV02_010290 [Purpureocillium takamizusanense]UNI24555.1 hypothetical protein JDV02_010290 [Purpureocillium takamizusanense]